ncbi:MAG: hypothetical protein C4293_22130, partial [Nitrospiraceae bacterium]
MHRLGTAILIWCLATISAVTSLAQPEAPARLAEDNVIHQTRKPAGSFLSLDQAIRIGLANHPQIERSRYTALIAKALTKQTQGERYPWLEASVAESSGSLRIVTTDAKTIHDRGGHGFDPGGALPKHNQNMLTGGLILNQLITDFGYTAHRILASRATQAASDKDVLIQKALVILRVRQAYLNTLQQQRLTKVAEETLKRRKAIRDQVQALYQHQLKSKVDLDLVQVEISNAELALIQAQNEVKQQFAVLNNAMGLEGAEEYRLEDIPVAVSSAPPLETLVADGLKNRPELLGGRDRVQATDELLRAVKALNFGSLTAMGMIGVTKYWDVHDSGIHDNQVAPLWGVGATMRFPLFTGFKIKNQVIEASHHKGEAEQELQQLANEVILQVIRAYLAETTNAEQIGPEQERVGLAREALQLAQG